MTKYIIKAIGLSICLLPLSLCIAQVGINTATPAGIFHLDGKKDNPSSGGLTSSQTINDFIIDNNGNVGIGTITPQARLDIQADTLYGAFRMVDGTQKAGRLLMADNDGNAFWGMTKGGGGLMAPLETPVVYGGTTNTPITFYAAPIVGATNFASITVPGTYAFMVRWTAIYHNSAVATTAPVVSSDPPNFLQSKIEFRLFINDSGTYLDSNAADVQTQYISVTNSVPFSVYIPFTAKNINAGDRLVITVKAASSTERLELIAGDDVTSTSAIMFYKL